MKYFSSFPFLSLIVLAMFLSMPSRVAWADEDDMIVFDEDGDPRETTGDDETSGEGDGEPAPPPVAQRVEQVSDGQGLLVSTDAYDEDRHVQALSKNVPRFHLDGVFGPAIGISDLSSHTGVQIQFRGLYRPWKYFAFGVSFLGTTLMHKGVVHSGFSPTLDVHLLVPLPRKNPLSPAGAWEIGLFGRSGYTSQGVMVDKTKSRAEGVHLSAGAVLYFWHSDLVRFFGQVEVSFPYWTSLCEESAAIRHCEPDVHFSGKTIIISGGASFVVW